YVLGAEEDFRRLERTSLKQLRNSWCATLLTCAAMTLPRLANAAASPIGHDASAGVEFFEKKIRPIFVENCYKCHSKEAEKLKGELLLDTCEGLLKGGENGPAIVAG